MGIAKEVIFQSRQWHSPLTAPGEYYGKTREMMQSAWLPVLMQGSFNEIYIVDCRSFRFVHVNPAACDNLHYGIEELSQMTPADLARELDAGIFETILAPLRGAGETGASLETVHTRKDRSTYPIALRLFYCASGSTPVYIFIGRDTSADDASTVRLQTIREQEQARIARDIHDELGGNLAAIRITLALLASKLPRGDGSLAEKAACLDTLVERTMDAAQRITAGLRPPMLDFGIVAAIEWQASEFESQSGIACACAPGMEDIPLAPDRAAALLRVLQEALTNIGKHSRATRADISLRRADRHVLLKVTDNGTGIAPANRRKPGSFGLRGMAERVNALGGRVSVTALPGGGTEVAAEIPLAE